jgi:archaellum biogenesis ATPase FlaH
MPDPAPLRSGHDYQDLVAMRAILDLISQPSLIEYILLEADDAGSIDDVVIRYRDSSESRLQVKFSVDETDAWNWLDLLKVKTTREKPIRYHKGKALSSKVDDVAKAGKTPRPLLFKWFDSLRDLPTDVIVRGEIVTNRSFAADVSASLDQQRRLVFDRLPNWVQDELQSRYGSEENVRVIAARLQFNTEEPGFEELEAQVRHRFGRLLNPLHFLYFKDQVRAWGRQQKSRHRPKLVDIDEARRATRFYELIPLPENLEVPDDFVLPDRVFDEDLRHQLAGPDSALIILQGDAGAGKSTYVSDLYRRLLIEKIPVLRHHFWLSTTDPTVDRVGAKSVFGTLMSQLTFSAAEFLKDHTLQSPEPSRFTEWLSSASEEAARRDACIVVILDGLDHALVPENVTEANRIIAEIVAPRHGLKVLIATRPTHFPSSIASRKKTLTVLPRLGRPALAELIRKNSDAITIRDEGGDTEETLDTFIDAFAARTGSLALHVRIAIRILRSYGRAVSIEDLSDLPIALAKGALDFYRGIWETLDPDGRLVLHVLAEHSLPWLARELHVFLRHLDLAPPEAASAASRVRHLLEQASDGALSIHYSLHSFVRSLSEHADIREQLNVAMRGYLESTDAPEMWRWAYLPELELRSGNVSAVLKMLDHGWFAAAIAAGRPKAAVDRISIAAIRAGLLSHDVLGFMSVGVMHDYYSDAHRSDEDVISTLATFAARERVRLSQSGGQASMSMTALRDVIIDLAQDGSLVAAEPYYAETVTRKNDALAREARGEEIFKQLLAPWLSAAGCLGKDSDEVAELVLANRFTGYAGRLAAIYVLHAARFGQYAAAEPVLKASRTCDVYREVTAAFSQGALRYGAPIGTRIRELLDSKEPALRLLYAVRGQNASDAVERMALPGLEADYVGADAARTDWLNVLRDMLADARFGKRLTFERVYALASLRPSMAKVAERLEDVERVFVRIASGTTSIGTLLQEHPYLFRAANSPSASIKEQYSTRGFSAALCDVILDCAALRITEQLREGDVAQLLSSGISITQLAESLVARPRAAKAGGIERVLALLLTEADESLEGRSTRAEMYRNVLVLAQAFGRTAEASKAASRAGMALMSLGWHKDMFLSLTMDALKNIAKHDPSLVCAPLMALAAPVAHVHDFTDGDHTRYFPEQLGELLMEFFPDCFLRYYAWMLEREDLFTLTNLRRDYLLGAEASDMNVMLARTVRDAGTLKSLASGASAEQLRAIAKLSLGDIANTYKDVDADTQDSNQTWADTRPEPLPLSIDEVAPNRFIQLDRDEWFRLDHVAWARLWLQSSHASEAWNALREVMNNEHYALDSFGLYDVILDLRGPADAYWILVAASSWTDWSDVGSDKGQRAIQLVRENHPDHLRSFLFDSLSIQYERMDRFRPYPSIIGATLVEHMLNTDREDEAKALASLMVDLSKALTRSWRFPEPPWVHA